MYKDLKKLIRELFHREKLQAKLENIRYLIVEVTRWQDMVLRHSENLRNSMMDFTGSPTDFAIKLDSLTLQQLSSELDIYVSGYRSHMAATDTQLNSLSNRVLRRELELSSSLRQIRDKRVQVFVVAADAYKLLVKVTKARMGALEARRDSLTIDKGKTL